MLDDMFTYLQNIRSEPSGPPTQKAIEEICVPLTQEGEGEEKVYQVFRQNILPYTFPIMRPRCWEGVGGTGSSYARLVPEHVHPDLDEERLMVKVELCQESTNSRGVRNDEK